jgi:hypothetical protein
MPQPHQRRRYTPQELGALSREHESHGHLDAVSPGKLANGKPDLGGVSYGPYQMTSRTPERKDGKWQSRKDGGNVQRFVDSDEGKPWASEFAGKPPGSPEFSAAWKRVAAKDPEQFRAANESFIDRTHNRPFVKNFEDQTGIDLRQRSLGLQQAAFSAAVQHGPDERRFADQINAEAARRGVSADKLTDRDICNTIYDEREKIAGKGTVGNRYALERAEAVRTIERGDSPVRSPAAREMKETLAQQRAAVGGERSDGSRLVAEEVVKAVAGGGQEDRGGRKGPAEKEPAVKRTDQSPADWPTIARPQ